ncbi:GNAT family N-acetyltransferase [Thermodesulfobacteriota bacterium]
MLDYNDTVRIFPAAPEHTQRLLDLEQRTFREAYGAHTRDEDIEAYIAASYSLKELSKELSDSGVNFFIGKLGRDYIGFVMLRQATARPDCVPDEGAVQLSRLYILKRFYGQGLGKSLLDKAVGHAVQNRHQTMWLSVWEKNTRALEFYRRQGFQRLGTQTFQVGSDPQKDIILGRMLE